MSEDDGTHGRITRRSSGSVQIYISCHQDYEKTEYCTGIRSNLICGCFTLGKTSLHNHVLDVVRYVHCKHFHKLALKTSMNRLKYY